MRAVLLVMTSLAFLSLFALSLHAQDVDTQKQLDVTLVRLERSLQSYDRCQQDYAELFVQARKLSIAYQQLQQDLAAAKVPPTQEQAPTSQAPPVSGSQPQAASEALPPRQ